MAATPMELNGLVSDVTGDWMGGSLWQAPELEISRVKSSASISAISFLRGGGETIWRGDRHRLVLAVDELPWVQVQVEHGETRQKPAIAPGSVHFYPAEQTIRVVHPGGRFMQVMWDPNMYSILLPEIGMATSRFEFLLALQDPLIGHIIRAVAEEIDNGFGDDILMESLGTAMCIRVAQRFMRHLPLPTSNGLTQERLQRVRDYIEVHLHTDLSLTVLAEIGCLSPYHFSRSFKQAVGMGPPPLRHPTQARTCQNLAAPNQGFDLLDCIRDRLHRPKPLHHDLPPRNRSNPPPLPCRSSLKLQRFDPARTVQVRLHSD